MKDAWHTRSTLVTLLLMSVLAPVLIWGALNGSRSTHNAPIRWIPASHPQRQIYQQFLNEFQTQEAVVVSWRGCTVDDERLQRFRDAILSPRITQRGDDHSDLFQQVISGYTMVEYLSSEPFELPPKRATSRLQGTLVGPDAKTSCAIVMLTEYGSRRSKSVIDAVLTVVEKDLGIARDDCFLGGSPVDVVAIDTASAHSIKIFLIPSTVVVLLFARLCLRSWPLSLVVIATALFGQGMVLALVYYLGVTMNAVLTVMAPLVLVLTVSAGVHLVNYHHDEIHLRGKRGAVQRALAHGWAPCLLAALTTAIGLGSLMVSNVIPVSQFGLFAGVGVLTTAGLLFLVVPGTMVTWPVDPEGQDAAAESRDNRRNPRLISVWGHYGGFVCRHSPLILVVCLSWMLVSVWGVSKLRTSVNVLNLLAPGSRTVRDYRWLERNVAPMLPIEIILTVDGNCPLDALQQIELVRELEGELEKLQGLEGTMSAATFFPSIPDPGGVRRMARRVLLRKKLQNQYQALVDAHYLYDSCNSEQATVATIPRKRAWRITARVPESASLDYGVFLEQVRGQVQRVLHKYGDQANGISTAYTGIMPLVYDVQGLLLSDLIHSYSTALVLVAIVMIVVQRSVIGGLVAMVPNMFPTLVLFGTMGWLNKPVDIGSMMTASVALGIAVDGTLHFLYWFRREVRQGASRKEAVGQCYRHCAKAIIQTAIICGIGLLVYSLSGFVPTRRFAWMMCALLTAALVGDLLLLPALLVGPLGKFFLSDRSAPAPGS